MATIESAVTDMGTGGGWCSDCGRIWHAAFYLAGVSDPDARWFAEMVGSLVALRNWRPFEGAFNRPWSRYAAQ